YPPPVVGELATTFAATLTPQSGPAVPVTGANASTSETAPSVARAVSKLLIYSPSFLPDQRDRAMVWASVGSMTDERGADRRGVPVPVRAPKRGLQPRLVPSEDAVPVL